jgi:signal peptidase I
MFTRVVAYPTGDIIVYDGPTYTVYSKNKDPKIKIRLYNKKDVYEFSDGNSDIRSYSNLSSRDELFDDVSPSN